MYFNFSFCGSRIFNGYEQINILHHAPRLYVRGFSLCPASTGAAAGGCGSAVHRSGAGVLCAGCLLSLLVLLVWFCWSLSGVVLWRLCLALWAVFCRGAVGVLGGRFRAVVGGSASCGETPGGGDRRRSPGRGSGLKFPKN